MTPAEKYFPRLQPPLEWDCYRDDAVCLWRRVGGLGDILAARMIFADVKKQSGKRLVVALPLQYHPAVADHPDIDELRSDMLTSSCDYSEFHDVSSVCASYECAMEPQVGLNRADIWAWHCGYELTSHDMKIRVSDGEVAYGRRRLNDVNPDGKKVVALCPVTSTLGRDMTVEQMQVVVDALGADYCLVALHDAAIPGLPAGVPILKDLSIRQLFGVAANCDAAICCETSHSHLFGGLGKPTVGVYSSGDGDVYGRWYRNWATVQHRNGFKRLPDMWRVSGQEIVDGFWRLKI